MPVRFVIVVGALTIGLLALGRVAPSFAKDKPKSAPGSTAKKPPPGEAVNACGCYHDAKGGCVCTDRKGKCECPGECEPVGCGEKRDKEIEREMAAEIKRAQDDEKKREAEREAREAKENGAAEPDAGEPPPPAGAKPAKPRKDVAGKNDAKSDGKADSKTEKR
ncbi:MAG TPA: hypothetical protein VHL80_18705 [Polyangia bacterium]|nr:hypothetical protein [Polyangia bacterium]